MTIDEATEILKILTTVHRARLNVYERDATKLGIEALEAYKKLAKASVLPKGYLLPGETKD